MTVPDLLPAGAPDKEGHTALGGGANQNRQAPSQEWHIITPEYPPQPGGVSDYTRQVAHGLADAGDEVHVWCPPCRGRSLAPSEVSVHEDLGGIQPPDLRRMSRALDLFPAPRRLLVQWVPTGYGLRSMNLPFCLWVWNRARMCGDHVELMVHEPFLPFRRIKSAWKQNAAAAIQRVMIAVLLQAAQSVWMSIPGWEPLLRPLALDRRPPFQWLPVPSNIAMTETVARATAIRHRFVSADGFLLGHFGTYGGLIEVMLTDLLPQLLRDEEHHHVVLIGRDSDTFCESFLESHPGIRGRIHATGSLNEAEISAYISACDLMIQPYPDGVSARRTSFMAGLSHGKPMVTTIGHLTEPFWVQCRAVGTAPAGNMSAFAEAARRLLQDDRERKRLSEKARTLYAERFDLRHTIALLREPMNYGGSCR